MLLSKSDCEYILSFWNDSISNGSSKYLKYDIDSETTITYRTKVSGNYIDFNNHPILNKFLLEKLNKIGITNIPSGFKIAKYSKGDYFEPHHDFNFYGAGALYKTLVIQLSDPSTYIGGDLCVKGVPQTRKQGDYSLFLSSDIHEVKLVEDGTRFSLTFFLSESNFEFHKSII